VEEEGLLGHDDSASHLVSPTARQEKKDIVGMLGAIKHPDYRKAVFAVIMVMIAQQLTGKFVFVLFSSPLLTLSKESTASSCMVSAYLQICSSQTLHYSIWQCQR
jgi:hypothetical protein